MAQLHNFVSMQAQIHVQGFHTNYSLQATAATRLFQASVDEQLIMERTGHRTLERVQGYKRTSDNQRETLRHFKLQCSHFVHSQLLEHI